MKLCFLLWGSIYYYHFLGCFKIEMGINWIDRRYQFIWNLSFSCLGMVGNTSRPFLECFKWKRKRVMPWRYFVTFQNTNWRFGKIISTLVILNLKELILGSANEFRSKGTIWILLCTTLRNFYFLHRMVITSVWCICSKGKMVSILLEGLVLMGMDAGWEMGLELIHFSD